MTPDEVAGFVRTSERTLRRWRAEGVGPPFVKLGRVIRYRRSALEAWLRAKERQGPG
jgi:excisionase family DNA binding protein